MVTLFLILVMAAPSNAFAQKHRRKRARKKPKPTKVVKPRTSASAAARAAAKNKKRKKRKKGLKTLDFTGLDLAGRMRTPQLLYFLERASQELDAASLERRSFVPEMVRSIDEEAL